MTNQPGFSHFLVERVDEFCSKWKLTEGQAFGLWYAMEGLGLDESDALEAVSYDGANDKDVDLFLVDEDHERVIVAQTKFNRRGRYRANKNELLGLIHSTDWLSNKVALEREGRPDLVGAADDYAEAIGKGYSIQFHYVFAGPPNEPVAQQADLTNNAKLDEHPSQQVSIIDLPLLEALHIEAIGGDTRVPEATIELEPEKYFPQEGAYGKAVVTTISGAELRKLHEQFGDKLFARNVRLFLTPRSGSVNAGIRDTLASTTERRNFWAYNNGVTVVCDRYELDKVENQLRVYNFSIVNGCQTTVSLSKAGESADGVEVSARIIAAPERLIDDIIFYTNSQSPVRGWELRSQDRLQKRLQAEMAEEPNPYYYALRRGESATLRGEDRLRFIRDGQFQSIAHEELAQYLAAFRRLPYIAYKEKGRIFNTYYDQVFPQDLRVEEALLAWRTSEAVTQIHQQALRNAIANNDSLETTILKRGGRIFTTAVVGHLLELRNGPNYLGRLSREVATSRRTLERLRTYAQVAIVLYVRATRQMVGQEGLQRLAPVLRTQESYPGLRRAVQEEWQIQSINKEWVDSLPKL